MNESMNGGEDGGAALNRREFLGAALGAAVLAPRALAAQVRSKPAPAAPARLPPLETIALSRLAFGPTPAELDALRSGPGPARARVAAWLESQLHPETISDADCERRLAAGEFETLGKSLKSLWQDHFVAANALRDKAAAAQKQFDAIVSTAARAAAPKPAPFDEGRLRLQPVREVEQAAWLRAVFSRRQLHEVLVDFWHDHFNVFAWDFQIAPTFVAFDRDVIRRRALGNFRELLGATARSPAMLFYLDNALSQSANPNENYARELFELHALGAENYLGTKDRSEVPGYAAGTPTGYVDGDVYEAARALTGWRVADGRGVDSTGEFLYYEPWHDRFQKIVLGRSLRELQPPMKDGDDVLDFLAEHPGTARYICRRLCRRLVEDEPSSALVAAAAKVFHEQRRASDQLRRVVRAIASSEEFRTAWGRKMRRPFEVAVAMLRATGAQFQPSEAFLGAQARAGQRLFQWRTPDGYPDDHERWGGTSPTLERWRTANLLLAGAWPGTRVEARAQTPAKARTPRQVARWWCARVLGRPASRATTEGIALFLAQGRNPGSPLSEAMLQERLAPAVALALMSPEFQLS